MKRIYTVCAVLLAFVFFFGAADIAMAQLKLVAPEYSPITFQKDDKLQGIGVDRVTSILNEAGIQFTTKWVPNYGKCLEDLKNGDCDGFFLGSKNAERDEVADLSNAIMISNWTWFMPKDSTLSPASESFKTSAKTSAFLNSNQHKWLTSNGYNVAGTPSEPDALYKMVEAGRVDGALVAEQVFVDSLERAGKNVAEFKKEVHSSMDLGIYISKKYLAANPGVMEKINAAITKLFPNGVK